MPRIQVGGTDEEPDVQAIRVLDRPQARNPRYPLTSGHGVVRVVDDVESAFEAGDADALKAVYDAHGSLVYTFCARTVGVDLAADVTQEVFISAWRSRHRFDSERGSLAGWLMGIAKHRCIDALRRAGRRPQVSDVEVEDAGTETRGRAGRSDAVDQMADRMLLAEALGELSDRARRNVELAFFSELTHHEIAHETGQPIGTVKSDIRRGLARLRRHLEHHDV